MEKNGSDEESEEDCMSLSISEQTLVELRIKTDDMLILRSRLAMLKAEHVGTFQQRTTYFRVPEGRLKLRQTNTMKTELIYHHQQNISDPRRGDVFALEIRDDKPFIALLKKILPLKAIVNKTRETYWHEGTQVHLDIVDFLGNYVKLERRTSHAKKDVEKNVEHLRELMNILQIKPEGIEKLSYGDLINLKR